MLRLRWLLYRLTNGGSVRMERFDCPDLVLIRGEVRVNVQGHGFIVLDETREPEQMLA